MIHYSYLSFFFILYLFSCSFQEPHSKPYHRAVKFNEKATKKLLSIAGKEGNRFNTSRVKALIIKGADVFIEAGTDINAKDKYGQTPLALAWNEEIVAALIHAGADPRNRYGSTLPLAEAESADIAESLITHGTDVHTRDKNGDTPLHLVEDAEVAEVLIKYEADVNAKNNLGDTPLHKAENTRIARLLVKRGADIDARNKDGKTPLETNTNEEVVKFLKMNCNLYFCGIQRTDDPDFGDQIK